MQAQAVVHVFVDGRVKALQHIEWQLRQIAVMAGSGFDSVGHGFVGIAEGLAFFTK